MATYNRNLASGGRLTLTVTTHSQNITNNTSRISWSLTLTDTSDIRMWANGSWSWSVKIGGTTLGSGTRSNYDYRNYDTLTLGSGTSTITHNSDGTRSDTWYGAFTDIGAGVGWFGNGTASGSYTIKTIPRATTAAWNTSGTKYVGTTERLNLPRASTSFTHDVTYKIGSKSGTVGTGLGAYVNWAIPVNLLTEFPNSASGSGTFTTVTKSGSTTIGTKTSGFTVTARATDVPTISSVLWDDDNTTVKTNIGAFVQGLSLIKGAVSASGLHGSSITEKRLRIGSTLIPEGVPVQITGSGTVVATAEAVDSRGKVGSAPANFSVLPYEAPTLGSGGWQVSRANASNVADVLGQYLRIDLHAVAATLKVASVEKNALRVAVRTKASDGAWINRNVINPGLTHNGAIQVSGGAQFVVSKSYEVEVSLSDNTGTSPTVLRTTVPTATVALDLNGTQVGIGKYHERGALDVGGDIHSTGDYFGGLGRTLVTDWDLATSPGLYTANAGANNAPASAAYQGLVLGNQTGTRLHQILTPMLLSGARGTLYIRYLGSTGWTAWATHTPDENTIGQVTQFAGDTAPSGWLLCQGQAVSRTTYAALYEVLGDKYGAGNGSSTFNVPDLRGRVAAGLSTDTEFNTLGKKTGAKTHTLTTAQMPTHRHSVTGPSGGALSGAGGGGSGYSNGPGYAPWFGGGWNAVAATVSNAGSGNAHNNIQPTITLNYIIKT